MNARGQKMTGISTMILDRTKLKYFQASRVEAGWIAALRSLLSFYGREFDEEDLLNMTSFMGTMDDDWKLIYVCSEFGIKCVYGMDADWQVIARVVKKDPLIVRWTRNGRNSWSVIWGIFGGKVFLLDSLEGEIEIDEKEFLENWYYLDNEVRTNRWWFGIIAIHKAEAWN